MYAQAYDNPIPGYNTKTVGNLRLFEALPETEFELHYFNEGDFPKVSSPGLLCTWWAGVCTVPSVLPGHRYHADAILMGAKLA